MSCAGPTAALGAGGAGGGVRAGKRRPERRECTSVDRRIAARGSAATARTASRLRAVRRTDTQAPVGDVSTPDVGD